MATNTENYNLIKPEQNDYYEIDQFNANADIIDALLKDLFDKTTGLDVGGTVSADGVSFDDSAAELNASTVQAAILALKALLDDVPSSNHPHSTDDITSGILPVARGGLGNSVGKAASADKLENARNIRVDLGSRAAASFDGSAAVNPGVSGILPAANGGTGFNSLDALATALGVARIQTGSYSGTGTHGSSNPSRLTFDFVPKAVIVAAGDDSGMGNGLGVIWLGQPGSASDSHMHFTLSNKTLSWYYTTTNAGGPLHQLNMSGAKYHWIAFG